MKQNSFAFAVFMLITGPAISAPDEYRFVATIQVENEQPQTYSVALTPGQTKSVDAVGKLRLEFSAPNAANEKSETTVRLLDTSGASPVQKHQATNGSAPTAERTLTYVVCGGTVRYISPSPKTPFICKG